MDVLIESYNKFEKEMKKLPTDIKEKTIRSINDLVVSLKSGEISSHKIYKLKSLDIGDSLNDSLYILKINLKYRAIISIESDPIFDKINLSLFHIVNHSSLNNAFKSITQSLYQSNLNGE